MSQRAITIYTPSSAEPHITAEDDAFIYDALLRGRSGILGDLKCVASGNNSVILSGGGATNRGHIAYIPTPETLTVNNGTQDVKRYDLVVSEFTRGGGTAADKHIFKIVQGTAAASPVDPPLTTSELVNTGDVNQVALFRVILDGVSISTVEPVVSNSAETMIQHLKNLSYFSPGMSTLQLLKAMPINTVLITVSTHGVADSYLSDAPTNYGILHLYKGANQHYMCGWFYPVGGGSPYYCNYDTDESTGATTSHGWRKTSPRREAGSVTISNIVANTPKSANVTFSRPFEYNPSITVTPNSSNPSAVAISVQNVTPRGFTIVVNRTVSGSASVYWQAEEQGSF